MRVILVYPNDRMDSLISSGISVLSAHLKSRGHEVKLFDTTFYDTGKETGDFYREQLGQVIPVDLKKYGVERQKISLSELQNSFRKEVIDYNPGLIAFSALEITYDQALELARAIQDIPVPKIFGGIYPTFAPRTVLKEPSIDMICEGEGEEMLPELADALEKGNDITSILNLTVKKEGKIYRSGKIVELEDLPTGNNIYGEKTGLRRPLVDLNNIEPPDFSIYDDRRFWKKMGGKAVRAAAFELSRGCPYFCTFCCSHMQQYQHKEAMKQYSEYTGKEIISPYHREKSIDKFIEEVKSAIKDYGINFIYFTDESFLSMSEERFWEFVEKYKEIRLPFFIEVRPETVKEGYAKELESINCAGVAMGIESGNSELRKELLKRFSTNEEIINAFKEFGKTKIRISANNIIGFPGETREDIMQTIELNREIGGNVDSIVVNGFRPYAGTELRKVCLERDLIPEEEREEDNRTYGAFNNGILSAEEIQGIRRVFNLYVKFPKDRWDEIRKAETNDLIFESLKKEFKEKQMLWRKKEDLKFEEIKKKAEGSKKIVYATMCGDLFHIGHLNLLRRAKEQGDLLIVGVLTDEAIQAYKRKPIIPFEQRMEILNALECVDIVVPQHVRDGTENLRKLNSEGIKIDVLVRGNDALLKEEVDYIKSIGGEFVHLPYTRGISTTEIIEKIKNLNQSDSKDS